MPKGLKRYYGQDHLHFLTCGCYHRQPWLATPSRRDLFSQILEETRQRYSFVVVGYVVMPDTAAELLFQVIAGRAERAAVIVTTNLPFSEWTTKFPNARLCKAMLDRLTDQAHILETGDESYRFRRTLAKKGGKA